MYDLLNNVSFIIYHDNFPVLTQTAPHNCELNPIELVWVSVKEYVAKHDKTHNLPEIEQLTPDRVTYTTTDMWSIFCRHVVDIENDYFEKDNFFEDTTE